MEHLGTFRQSLITRDVFSVTWELVPGRGAREKAQEEVFIRAEQAAGGGKVHALTVTDNPGGHPAFSAEMLGAAINRLGIEPLVHFTCKDKNRNLMESLLHGLERADVRNLLVMTGDYPAAGYLGRAKPVFDLDPVHVLGMIGEMNRGKEVPSPKGVVRLAPSHFFPGAVVSPFKATEAEQITQYQKLGKKLASGAQFIVSQLGYDARKLHELLQAVRHLGYGHIPVLGNIYILSPGAARLMNRDGLPGCVVTDELLATLERESTAADKGRAQGLERAARMYALMKGMGFAGVHIAGHRVSYGELEFVLGRGEELVSGWMDLVRDFQFPQPGGFYFFEGDPETGLNVERLAERSEPSEASLAYTAMRAVHHLAFDPEGALFGPMQALARAVDGRSASLVWARLEHLIKLISSGCENCGDCALSDLAYLCPMSQCPKAQRNGPCGGGRSGFCEVYPEGSLGARECIFVRAYRRLKNQGAEDQLGGPVLPPLDHSLQGSSSWINFYLGRDHSVRR